MARDTQGDARQKLIEDVAAEVRRQIWEDREAAAKQEAEVERQMWAYPHDRDMELRVIGAMLLAPRHGVQAALQALGRGDFWDPAIAMVFEALHGLHETQQPTDDVIADMMQRQGAWTRLGAFDWRTLFLYARDAVPTWENLPWYCERVRELSIRRQAVAAAEMAASAARDMSTPLPAIESLLSSTAGFVKAQEGTYTPQRGASACFAD